jgi:hypothetical protein
MGDGCGSILFLEETDIIFSLFTLSRTKRKNTCLSNDGPKLGTITPASFVEIENPCDS